MVAIIVFIFLMIFDMIIGTPLPANNEIFQSFSIFHDCMSRIPFENVHESCRNAESCLDDLFDEADDYLNAKAETKAKLEVKHELDNLKQDCSNIFDMDNDQLFCQMNGIQICINRTSSNGPLCEKLFVLRDCLGPFELDCWNRIFASILRSISHGIWETNSCSNLNSTTGTIKSPTKKVAFNIMALNFNNTKYISTTNKPYVATNPTDQYRIFNIKSRSLNLVKEDEFTFLNDNVSKVDGSLNEDVTEYPGTNCTPSSECNYILLGDSEPNSKNLARDFIDIPDFTDETILTTTMNNVANTGIPAGDIIPCLIAVCILVCMMSIYLCIVYPYIYL